MTNKGMKYNQLHKTPRDMTDQLYERYYNLMSDGQLLNNLRDVSSDLRREYEVQQLMNSPRDANTNRIRRRWDNINKQPKVQSQGILPDSKELGLVADVQSWTCLHGHQFETSQMLLIRNSGNRLPQGCPVCSRIEAGQAKLTPGIYRNRVKNEVKWCDVLEDYAGSEVRIKHQCHYCNEIFMAKPGSILAGLGSCKTYHCHSIGVRRKIREAHQDTEQIRNRDK